MSYVPIEIDFEGKNCLVVGGGEIAYKKMCTFYESGATISVIAPDISEKISRNDRIIKKCRKWKPDDVETFFFVIAATSSDEVNAEVESECKKRNILCLNVSKGKHEISLPAIHKQGDIVVSVSTGGKSPRVSQYIREKISEFVTEDLAELNDKMGELRSQIQKDESLTLEEKREQYDQFFESELRKIHS